MCLGGFASMRISSKKYDVIVIGAGAAGLMCAAQAVKRGRSVLLLDKAEKAGKKILISGGGRCNFTNFDIDPQAYISNNPHFCKSALSQYTQWDFISLMGRYNLTYSEKTKGQLFCEQKSPAILEMLLSECNAADIFLNTEIVSIEHENAEYIINTNSCSYKSKSLVIATGGASIPKMGATDFGLQIAKQFGIKSIPFKPALVPFTFLQDDIDKYFKGLSGVSFSASVSCGDKSFDDMVLITHRGLSGPAILQISSYWQKGESIEIDILPSIDAEEYLTQLQQTSGKAKLINVLNEFLSKNLAERLTKALIDKDLSNNNLGSINKTDLQEFGKKINHWILNPSGTEGMRTAEVCTGGVDTNELSSKTMESKTNSGLYFIGETVDVTGWLGGYNFQWSWSSGWVAGQVA